MSSELAHAREGRTKANPSFASITNRCTQPPTSRSSRGRHWPAPSAAWIFAGHARTFVLEPVHQGMLSNAVLSFETDAYTFVLLSSDDPGSTKGNAPVRSEEWSVRAAVARLRPKAFVYETCNNSTHQPNVPKDCKLNLPGMPTVGDGYHRIHDTPWWLGWWQTWDKLGRAFKLVQKYEASHYLHEASHAPFRFDWVMRMRPDAWFFAPGPAYCQLAPSRGIFTPAGVAGCVPPCVNDHLAWAPRKWADAYFLSATPELENCHGSELRRSMRDYGYYLMDRLRRRRVPLADTELVPYTIVRACFAKPAPFNTVPANGTDIHGAAPACKRVLTASNGLVLGMPGFGNIANVTQRQKELKAQCVSQWPIWPGAPGVECATRKSSAGGDQME